MLRVATDISEPEASPAALLDIRDVSISYRDRTGLHPVVRHVSLTAGKGETVALVGESGSGKSTLARAVIRLLPASGRITSGSIRFEGREVTALGRHELQAIRGARVGFVFQDPDSFLNPVFPVGKQICDVIRLHQRVDTATAARLAEEQLARVDFKDPLRVMSSYPHQLSGGMRQRVLMAIATCCGPSLLIADEPTTALDVLVQRQVLQTMNRLKREIGMTILLVTHDLGVVAEYADRVAVMYAGSIVEVQSAATIFTKARHPYTHGLIAAAEPARERFATLGGSAPRRLSDAPGCAFAPRCARMMPRCSTETPHVVSIGPNEVFACWNPLP